MADAGETVTLVDTTTGAATDVNAGNSASFGSDPNNFGGSNFFSNIGAFLSSANQVANSAAQTSASIRDATAYATQQVRSGALNPGVSSNLPWYQSTWLYASNGEKALIVVGLVFLAVAIGHAIAKS